MHAPSARSRPRSRGPLCSPPFRMLLAGQSLSNIGNYVHTIAFPWLVLGPHEDVAMLGTVVAASGIATMAGIPLGGYLADRLGSWRVMLWSDCSQIVFATTLALMAYLLAPSLAWLLPLDVCAGFCGGLFIPSSMSVIPALLPEDQIGRGVTIYSGGLQLVGVIGPALGGLTVALTGAPCALAIDAGSYLASTLTLLGVRKFMTAAALSASDEPDVTTEQTKTHAGAAPEVPFSVFAHRARLLQVILGVAVVFYLAYPGVEEVAMPDLARRDFGASGYGTLLTVQALCALLGTMLAGKYAQIKAVPYLQAALIATFGIAVALIPYAGGLPGALVAMAVFSAAMSWQGIGIITIFQTWTPEHLLGRTMSVLMTVSQGLTQVSVIVFTVIIRHVGPAPTFLLAGSASVFTALALVAFPTFRRYRLGDSFTMPQLAANPPAATDEASNALVSPESYAPGHER